MPVNTYEAPLVETLEQLRKDGRELEAYVNDVCDRIEEVDPTLNVLLPEPDRRKRLLGAAAELRSEYPSIEERPPLYGIPVGIKDNITVDGLQTRAGGQIPAPLIDSSEAPSVTRIRRAGGLIVGKTVTTEYTGGAPWLTRNPHDLTHTPGGSSSGSAAGVAAGLCPASLGIQTGGSVIRPAAFCGIVGMKPTFGRIPTDGVVTRSHSLDTIGVFCQDVSGVEVMLSVLFGDFQADGARSDGRPAIGVPEGSYLDQASDEAIDVFDSQMDTLSSLGYSINRVEVPAFERPDEITRRHRCIMNAELVLNHREEFDEFEDFYGVAFAEKMREGEQLAEAELEEARRYREQLRSELERVMRDHSVDLWATPAALDTAPAGLRSTGDSAMNRPWSYVGFPAITVPASMRNGLPIGLQLVATPDDDERLVEWAGPIGHALSEATG